MDSVTEARILHLLKKDSPSPILESEPNEEAKVKDMPLASSTKRFILDVALDDISVSPFQTREIHNDEELSDLKSSIQSRGIIQPIIVRELPIDDERETSYELIAGERRFRAAKLAGLDRIPAIVNNLNNQESLEVAIIENAQRENLNPIEEALAFKMLAEQFEMNQTEIAHVVGKNRTTISNSLRLLQLEPHVIELLKSGELSAGHGRAILAVENKKLQKRLAWRSAQKSLSVRALELLIAKIQERQNRRKKSKKDESNRKLDKRNEEKLSTLLGIEKVRLRSHTDGHRQLSLTFDSESSWKRFVAKIRN